MGYPGNHGEPDGWQAHRPLGDRGDDEPAAPYGQPPYGHSSDEGTRYGDSPYSSLEDRYGAASSDPTGSMSGGSGRLDPLGSVGGSRETGRLDPLGSIGTSGETGRLDPLGSVGSSGETGRLDPLGSIGGSRETGRLDPLGPVAPAGQTSVYAGPHAGAESGPDAIGYERSRGYGGPRHPKPKRKTPVLMIAGAVTVVFALVGGGIAFALRGDDKPASEPGAQGRAGAPQPSASAQPPNPQAQARNIRSRKTDPRPLTLAEVFKQTKFSEGGGSYIMTKRRSDKDCSNAVTGSSLETALRRARCTQVLRATFTTTGGKLVGTIGIANLSTENAARVAARAARGGRNYVEPLRGSGNTRNLGRSGSSAVGTADVRGHYLILSWVQYPSGKKIAKAHYPAISKFERNVIVGCSLGTALGHRMVTGKPSAG